MRATGGACPAPTKAPDMFGDLVGAHRCVRPCTKVARLQRADTSVGPYRGSIAVLYFGGVASIDCVQRAGHAPPLQRYQTHKRGASPGAPTCLLTLLLRIQICVSRVRARRPGAGRGYGVQRIRGTGAGSPDPWALAERAENSASRSKEINGMNTQQKGNTPLRRLHLIRRLRRHLPL